MSIKNQLRAAILSGGAKAFCPRGDFVDFNSQTFVAPQNGYICLGVRSTAVNQWFSLGASVSQVQAIPNAGQNPEGYIPVRKGETARLAHSDGMPVNFMRFFPSVGGGKSPVVQLVRRVVPCLRNCLTRVLTRTLKAKRTGSGSNLFRLPQPSNINGHRAIGMKSFLLKRGGFPFELRLLGTLKSLNLVLLRTIRPFQCQPSPGTLDTSERPFLLGKGSRSASRSQGTSLRPVFTSGFIGLRAEPNLCFGGASYE